MLGTAILVSLPVLLTIAAVGLVVSVLQALTQIQEQSLAFVPKWLAGAVVIVLTAPWMIARMVAMTGALLGSLGAGAMSPLAQDGLCASLACIRLQAELDRRLRESSEGCLGSLDEPVRRRRGSTTLSGRTPLAPEVQRAREFEERLTAARGTGQTLVPTARSPELGPTEDELCRRYSLSSQSVETLLLEALEAVAQEQKIPWDTLVKADAAGPGGPHWGRLTQVVDWAVRRAEEDLRRRGRPLLLKDLGLLARYEPRLELIERLQLDSGKLEGPPLVWVLASVQEPGELPRIDRRALPLPPAQAPVFLSREWRRLGSSELAPS